MQTASWKALRRRVRSDNPQMARRARAEIARRCGVYFAGVAALCQIASLPVAVWAVLK